MTPLARLRAWIPAIVFLAAGTLKALMPDHAAGVLAYFGFSQGAIAVLLPAMAALEVALGLALFASGGHRTIRLISVAVLVFFAATLAILLADKDPPDCGCFGPLRLDMSHRAEIMFGIGRNITLIGVLLWPCPGRDREP